MKSLLAKIVGDPGRSSLESRIYNALTFFTPLATVFVIPLFFIIDLSVYHKASVLLICALGFYLYYRSRFKKSRSEIFLLITGLVLLSIIWITGYGSVGYAFLFYQFLMFYSLLVLENKPRMFFFLLIPAIVFVQTMAEFSGLIVPKEYTSDEKRTIDFLINYMVWFIFTGFIIKIIIDNFRMERQRLEDEFIVAQKLQMRLLPHALPDIPGYSMHAFYLPMSKVGGDFYDYRVTEDSFDVLIADVSGHGLSSAFLATITKMAFEYERQVGSTADVLSRVNRAVVGATAECNFVTAFYCSIDRKTSLMRCSSAGHFPVFIYRSSIGALQSVKPRGKPMGWIDDPGIEEIKVQLEPGDRLILYTDGVTECFSARGEMFGMGAFTDFIQAAADKNPQDFTGELIRRLRYFSGADFFDDDMTVLVIDVKK